MNSASEVTSTDSFNADNSVYVVQGCPVSHVFVKLHTNLWRMSLLVRSDQSSAMKA